MWLWVKPSDPFGRSLLRMVRTAVCVVALIAAAAGFAVGTCWVAIKLALAPIMGRF